MRALQVGQLNICTGQNGENTKFFIFIETLNMNSFKNIYFQVKMNPDDSQILMIARVINLVNESSELRNAESSSPCNHPSPDASEEGAGGIINNL